MKQDFFWFYASIDDIIDDIIDIEPYTNEADKSNDGTIQGGGLNELQ